MTAEQLLDEMVQAIVQHVDPERIVLFGSRATGKVGPDSDVDLLIVERESFGPTRSRRRELARIRRLLSRFQVPKDILVYGPDEFKKWRSSPNHIVGRSMREGRLLYERP
jgi:predicted nucleotidyltransferase